MGVGDVEAVISRGIAGNFAFFNSIDDFLAVLVLVQVFESVSPVACGADRYRTLGFAVGLQINGDGAGTDAVLVIAVVPYLIDGDGSLLKFVGVGYIVAVHLRSITINIFLGDGVFDLSAVISVLGQIVKAPFPLVVCINGHFFDFGTVSQQVNGDGCRTFAILVVIVDPGLGAYYLNNFGSMGVGNDVTSSCIAGDFGFITFNTDFRYSVFDFHACFELIQIGEGTGPVVIRAQSQSLAGSFVVCQQLDGDRVGADAVLVIAIVPGLGNGNGSLFGCVGIHNIVAVVSGGVILNSILGDCVVDEVAAIFVLGQTLEAPCPIICLGDDLGVDNLAVLQQVDGNGFGTGAILVVLIVPGLCACNGNGFGSMGIGNGEAFFSIAGDFGFITFNTDFRYSVYDFHT